MSAPTTAELRIWAQSLGLPVSQRGGLPDAVYERWNREHPDRQVTPPATRKRPGWTPSMVGPDADAARASSVAVRAAHRKVRSA